MKKRSLLLAFIMLMPLVAPLKSIAKSETVGVMCLVEAFISAEYHDKISSEEYASGNYPKSVYVERAGNCGNVVYGGYIKLVRIVPTAAGNWDLYYSGPIYPIR